MTTPRLAGGLLAATLLAATLLAASCSSGSKGASTQPLVGTTAPPVSTAAGGSTSTCRPATGPGATAADNVAVPGDIPDTVKYKAFTSPDGYTISTPEGWSRSDTAGTVTFTDKFNSIKVQVSPSPTAPTVASAQSTAVAALSATAACFLPGKVTTVSRTSGSGVLITYKADSPPDQVTGKVVREDVEHYEFWRAGKLAVITLSAPQGSDNVDPWRKVTDSFAWSA